MCSINSNQGAYFIENKKDTNILLFLYKKLSEEALATALPISFNKKEYESGKKFIGVIFKDNRDYLNQISYDDIKLTINGDKHLDILHNNYDQCQMMFPNITEQEYLESVSFSITQLE